MADIADRAADEESAFINNALNVQRDKAALLGEGLNECEDCGGEIPPARRAAVKGCTTCVGCQYERELTRGL
jgi:phage/conjugal plasmid C-4 type zinc finger TraR family protein